VQLLPDDAMVPVPAELASLASRLHGALKAMAEADDNLDPPPPLSDTRWQDAGWLSNRWAERLPLPAQERQRLMSLDNPVWRLELVAEWLDRLERQGQGQAQI
jgi:Lon protease-like protein